MATLRKPAYSRTIPADAKIIEKDAQRFARFKHKGRLITAPLTKDGKKVRVETAEWYVRYRDTNGKWKEVKGYTDKRATETLALKIQERVDQRLEGINPYKEHHERPLLEHVDDWEQNLIDQGVDLADVKRHVGRVRTVIEACGFALIPDLLAVDVDAYLGRRRKDREKRDGKKPMAARTHNFYVQALQRFGQWLVDKRRTEQNHLGSVAMLEITDDRRVRGRRALSPEEFALLVQAAAAGPELQGVSGPDRAMLYILAAWTGYRRAELASLTLRSFELDGPTPLVTVQAGYTKNRRKATVPLHPVVADQVRTWLTTKGQIAKDAPLFALKTAGGHWRKTAKMMRTDLEVAREKWIADARTPAEKAEREASDLLAYQNEDGLYADFHANRHTFISNLGKAGVGLTQAQKLARHSDPKLTSNIYTHLELHDQAASIAALPAPPALTPGEKGERESRVLQPTGTDDLAPRDQRATKKRFPPASHRPCISLHQDAQNDALKSGSGIQERGIHGLRATEEIPGDAKLQNLKRKGLGTTNRPKSLEDEAERTGFFLALAASA